MLRIQLLEPLARDLLREYFGPSHLQGVAPQPVVDWLRRNISQAEAQARAQAEQDMQIVAGRGAAQIKPVNQTELTSDNNPPANQALPQFDDAMEAEYQAWKASQKGSR